MLQRDRRLLRDQDDRTVRGGGAGQRLRRYQLDRNRNVGNLLPGLEPIKANRDRDVFRNAIAGAGKFDQCDVGFFIIRDDLRQTELRYAQSGDIGDIPVNIHIRAQPVARLVLHLGPDADTSMPSYSIAMPVRLWLCPAKLPSAFCSAVRSAGTAAANAEKVSSTARTAATRMRPVVQHRAFPRRGRTPRRIWARRSGESVIFHGHIEIPPHIALIHHSTILSGSRAACCGHGTGGR